MTRFGYDQKFFPSNHRISLEQRNLAPHITKETFVIEKNVLKHQCRTEKESFSSCGEGLKSVH